jgi:hypothetical protein
MTYFEMCTRILLLKGLGFVEKFQVRCKNEMLRPVDEGLQAQA